jgi:hypothetical protein
MFSFPASLMYGVAGIVKDSDKRLAIITTLGSGGLVLVYVFIMAR